MNVFDLEQIKKDVQDLRALLEEGEITETKSFIKSFVNDIKVIGDRVELTYTMPGLNDGNGFEVPHAVQNGGRYRPIDRTITFNLVFNSKN